MKLNRDQVRTVLKNEILRLSEKHEQSHRLAEPGSEEGYYCVKGTETLKDITDIHSPPGITVEDNAALNELVAPFTIKAGDSIRIYVTSAYEGEANCPIIDPPPTGKSLEENRNSTMKNANKKMTRRKLRGVMSEALVDYKSEMREFAETRGGKNVMAAGSKIFSAGGAIREAGMHQTGDTRKTMETVADFVEALGSALEGINSLNEGEPASSRLPTVNEFKQVVKAIEKMDR